MATGLEMFDVLKLSTRGLAPGSTFEINRFDAEDLRKLGPDDLVARQFDREVAEQVSKDLAQGHLDELSRVLGIQLVIHPERRNLILGEGLRRAAELLKNDTRSLEEIFEENDRIRHPERYPA